MNARLLNPPLKHWPLALLLLIFTSLSLYYSLVLPLGEASDETHHFALVRFITEQGRPPLTAAERVALGPKGDASPIYHSLVAWLTQHVDISPLPQLPDAHDRPERFIPADQRLTGQFLHTEDELFPFHGIVLAWRLARLPSILLGGLTVTAVYLTALALDPKQPVMATSRSQTLFGNEKLPQWRIAHLPSVTYWALAAAGFVAFLPRFVISSAVVNDDNLAIPLITFAVYVMVRISQGDERRRAFMILGMLIGLAAIVKYHSLILLVELALLLLLLRRRGGRAWPDLLRRGSWSLLAFSLTSAWWFIFLISRFNEVAERGWLGGLIAPLGDPVFTGGLGGANFGSAGLAGPAWVRLLFQSFWIEYGGLNILAPPSISLLLGLLALILLAGMVKGVWQSRFRTWPPVALLLAIHFLLYFGLVIGRYLFFPWPETAQGRHLYPALVSLAIGATWGIGQLLPARLQQAQRSLKGGLWLGLGGLFLVLALATPPLFILPFYRPYLPITTLDPMKLPISQRRQINFAPGVDLIGFDLPDSIAGSPLPLTLYWQAGQKQERDYLVRVCLQDTAGQIVGCRLGHPVDGRYPLRAWEEGYLIRDQIDLPLPRCLSSGDYELTLALLPLRPDRAATTVDEAVAAQEAILLGQINLSAPVEPNSGSIEYWAGKTNLRQGQLELAQLRQALTLIAYEPEDQLPADERQVTLRPAGESSTGRAWQPVTTGPAFNCGGGYLARYYHFIVDASVSPGEYRLELKGDSQTSPLVLVKTRQRNFNLPAALPLETRLSFAGELALLGYEVDLSPRRPGETIRLKSYWQAQRQMGRNYVAILKLLDKNFESWSQVEPVMGGAYPTVLWAPGEIVTDLYELPVGRQVPAGLYQIEVSLLSDYLAGVFHFLPVVAPGTAPVEHLYLGPIQVLDPATDKPPANPKPARLGDQIELIGYDLKAERGQPLQLALHWQALKPPALDYTVFVQLIGPDGLVKAQQDNQPQQGRFPTTNWELRAKVVDRYTLTPKKALPPGHYRLVAGMYDLATGRRLAAFDGNGERWADDAIILATLSFD